MNTELLPLDETGLPPEERLKDAASARKIFTTLYSGDELSQQNRAVVQAMIDGAPPYDPDALALSGAGYRYNFNHMEGSAMLESAVTSYTDLADSVDSLIRVQLPPTAGDATTRADMQDIIGEEFTTMVKAWPEFDANYQRLVVEMNTHGVGIAVFPRLDCWKWEPMGLDDVVFPRQTQATEEAVDVCAMRRGVLIHKLYGNIKDEAAATSAGWNVEETRKLIVRATRTSDDLRGWTGEWARIQRELKNNDLYTSYSQAQEVRVIHMLVREFDGSYSYYIFGELLGDFIFKRRGMYKNAANALVFFTNTISQNGTLHGVRGLAYRMFPIIQAMNRLRCSVLDGTQISNTLFLQPEDGASMEEPPLTVNGPIGFLAPKFRTAPIEFNNPATDSMPVIDSLNELLRSGTPTFRSSAVGGSGEKTKYQVQAEQELGASLSVSAVNMFYRAWGRLLAEMYRRVSEIRYNDSYFVEVEAFYLRCAERGVSPDVVKAVRRVLPVKAVGAGSVSARMVAFDEAMQLRGSFDEVGRKNVVRDRLAARFGRETADRYLPRDENPRPVIDEKIAELENASLRNAQPVAVLEGENHFVHVQIHLGAVGQAVTVWEQQRRDSQLDFEKLVPELEFVTYALDHVQGHLDPMAADDSRVTEFKAARQGFQNYRGVLDGFLAMYQRYLRDNRRQSEDEIPDSSEAAQGGPQQPEPQVQQTMVNAQALHELKIQQLRELGAVKLGLTAEEIKQRMAAKALEADVNMAGKITSKGT